MMTSTPQALCCSFAALVGLLAAPSLCAQTGGPERAAVPDLAFVHVGPSAGMGVHARLGVRVARTPVSVHVRGTMWPAEIQVLGGPSASSRALLVTYTYTSPLPQRRYLRTGVGVSRFSRTRRVPSSSSGFALLDFDRYKTEEAVGIAFESALGLPMGRFAAAEVLVLGDLNGVDTRAGLGVSLGLRLPGGPVR